MKHWPVVFILLAALGAGIWVGGGHGGHSHAKARVKYYQDSMHPWVKSDKPGLCPICAMDLSPIFEGEMTRANSIALVTLSKEAVTVANVAAEPVRRRDVQKAIRVSGVFEAQETRTAVVSAPAGGRIDYVGVDHAGMTIQEGGTLARLFSPDWAQKSRFLRVAMSNQLSTSFAPSKNTHSAGHTSVNVPGMSDDNPVPTVGGSRLDLFNADLPSPITGTVIDRPITVGQYVMEGQKLATIVDPSVLWFRFDAIDRQLNWIRSGQRIQIRTESAPGRSWLGVVDFVEPQYDEVRRVSRVRAVVTNTVTRGKPDARFSLLPGMLAEGRIMVTIPGVVAVPKSAVIYPGSSAWTFVEHEEGTYERRRVRLGREGDDWWEVLSGLKEGERVVATGNVLIDAQASFEMAAGDPLDSASEPSMAPAEMEAEEMDSSGTESTRVDPRLKAAVQQVLNAANGVSEGLSSDSIEAYNKSLQRLPVVVADLVKVAESGAWARIASGLNQATPTMPASTLKEARSAFLGFGALTAELAQYSRRTQLGLSEFHIYFCPMAPKPGLWVQSHAPLANPFYGARMFRCGEEIEPGVAIGSAAVAETMERTESDSRSGVVKPDESMHQHAGMKEGSVAGSPGKERENTNEVSRIGTKSTAGIDHSERLLATMAYKDELKSQMRAKIIAEAARRTNAPPPKMTEIQIKTAMDFLTEVEGIGRALANEDLKDYHARLPRLKDHFAPLLVHLSAPPRWGPEVEAARVMAEFGKAENLQAARERYEPFAARTVEFVKQLARADDAFKKIRLYKQGSDRGNRVWLQLAEPPMDPFAPTRETNAIVLPF